MANTLSGLKRSHTCGELRDEEVGQEVVLMGWVQTHRDLGGTIFMDLRDRYGVTQIRFDAALHADVYGVAERLRPEWVVAVRGSVKSRGAKVNTNMPTGTIEIEALEVQVFNEADTPPFLIQDEIDTNENLRLEYRFLDLRRRPLMDNLAMRSRVNHITRNFLVDNGFLELETPILTKLTPEGARDYLVPSRVYPGRFFALPQSPQIFKQLFMVAGYDRYFQICRCFRDEDLRADRQPEFTQIDMEMSFVTPEDVYGICETLIARIFKEVKDINIEVPIPRMTYAESMDRYGVDNPDVRFDLELHDVSTTMAKSTFGVFLKTLEGGGVIKAINVKGQSGLSRKQIDELTKIPQTYGAKGMSWAKINSDGWQSSIAKFLDDDLKAELVKELDLEVGDLALFVGDSPKVVNPALGNLRKALGARLELYDAGSYKMVWITDFPMFEYSDTYERLTAVHHPFTAPNDEDTHLLDTEPVKALAAAYDLVLNGNEIGGGSIRIHRRDIQEKVFKALGISDEEAMEKFGFLLKAFSYGAPPHGGIAFGMDRLIMILSGTDSIRDVIAFPKTQRSACLMTDAPSAVAGEQLDELGLGIVEAE